MGRACDHAVGTIGVFPNAEQVRAGWLLAEWWRANADALHVGYVIYRDRIWNRGDADWRPYGGGGVYSPGDVTGGHFDHVHVDVED